MIVIFPRFLLLPILEEDYTAQRYIYRHLYKWGDILLANAVLLDGNAPKMIRRDLLRSPDQILGVHYELVSL